MGAALCIRAWINLVTGYIGGARARAFGVLRLLSFLPSGLTREDLMALFVNPEDVRNVVEVIVDQFYLVEMSDKAGNRVHKYTAIQVFDQKIDDIVFRVRPCVHGLFAANESPLKFECARNLDNMLPRLQEAADIVHKTFVAARTSEGLAALELCEASCWCVTRPDFMLREGFIGHKHASIEACGDPLPETSSAAVRYRGACAPRRCPLLAVPAADRAGPAGHIALYLAMIMLSLDRNQEVRGSCAALQMKLLVGEAALFW